MPTVFGPASVICGVLSLCMIAVDSLAGIVVVAVLYGFFSGVFVAMPPLVFVRLTANRAMIGTRIGMGFAVCGFAVFIGGPAAGAILGTDDADLHWASVWTFGGVCTLASGVLLILFRFYLSKGKLWAKV
jgi:MFS family permease